MQITLDIDNEQDLLLLLSITNRIGIKVVKEKEPKHSLEYHKQVIAKGIKNSSFGNPVKWQKATRADRQLPLR